MTRVQHGAAPNERLIARVQECHGHQTHAIRFERLDALADRVGSLRMPIMSGTLGP